MDGVVADIIIAVVLAVIVGGAAAFLIYERRRGNSCVGCPYAEQCKRTDKCKK